MTTNRRPTHRLPHTSPVHRGLTCGAHPDPAGRVMLPDHHGPVHGACEEAQGGALSGLVAGGGEGGAGAGRFAVRRLCGGRCRHFIPPGGGSFPALWVNGGKRHLRPPSDGVQPVLVADQEGLKVSQQTPAPGHEPWLWSVLGDGCSQATVTGVRQGCCRGGRGSRCVCQLFCLYGVLVPDPPHPPVTVLGGTCQEHLNLSPVIAAPLCLTAAFKGPRRGRADLRNGGQGCKCVGKGSACLCGLKLMFCMYFKMLKGAARDAQKAKPTDRPTNLGMAEGKGPDPVVMTLQLTDLTELPDEVPGYRLLCR